MSDPKFIILYVKSPAASARFYADLLGQPALEAAENFAMFEWHPGVMLGLWARHDVQPAATAATGAAEIAFSVANAEAVQQTHDAWAAKGLVIAQIPTTMDFGHTFVALDPDGHRLRVMAAPAT